VGYTITQSVEVKVRDFSKAGDILSGVVGSGANSVSSLNFTIDDPTRVQSEARAQAIQKAKEQAETVAKAGGFKVGRLLSIDEGYSPVYDRSYGMGGSNESMKSMSAAPVPAIEPGSQDIVVNVNLRYEID
jgi:uncharacterized protein YggE